MKRRKLTFYKYSKQGTKVEEDIFVLCKYNVLNELKKKSEVKEDPDMNVRGFYPLWIASKNGHNEIVSFLLENNVSVDSSSQGETPLRDCFVIAFNHIQPTSFL